MFGCTYRARAVASSDWPAWKYAVSVSMSVSLACRSGTNTSSTRWRRAWPSPARTRSGSRSSLPTGRGASGQPTAARRPDSAARAEHVSRRQVVGAGADHDGAVPEEPDDGVGCLVRAVDATQDHHEPVALRGAQRVDARGPGRTAYLLEEVLAARRRHAAEDDDHSAAVRPAQRAGPRRDGLVGLGAQHGVDHQGLEPRVPRTPGLGGACVDLRGGEGDLACVAEHRRVDGGGVGRVDDLVDVRLDDLDAQAHQVDGLPEGDDAGEGAGCRSEHRAGEVAGRGVVVVGAEPVHEPLDARLQDLADPRAALGGELAEPRHVGEHPRHRRGAQRTGRASQGLGGALAGAAARGGGWGTARTLTARP